MALVNTLIGAAIFNGRLKSLPGGLRCCREGKVVHTDAMTVCGAWGGGGDVAPPRHWVQVCG